MYVVLSWAWEKFGKKNPGTKKRILVDEAWMMMSANIKGSEHTSAFLENMSRRIENAMVRLLLPHRRWRTSLHQDKARLSFQMRTRHSYYLTK